MATKKLEQTGLTRNECVNLYSVIRDIKSNGLSKDGLISYIMLRLKLKDVVEQFEKVRTEIAEQTKPDGWKEGDSTEEWDKSFAPVMDKWLQEKTDIESNTLSMDDCAAIVSANSELVGRQIDVIVEYMKK